MAQAPLNFHEKPASQFALKCYSNAVVRTVFFCEFKGFDGAFGFQIFHDVENDFAGVTLLKAVSVGEVAVFENVGKSYSGRQAVENDFENAANHIAFNHDDEWSVILVSDVS